MEGNILKKIINLAVIFLVFGFVMVNPLFAQSKVNINTANLEELKALNGVGQARAKDILKYRDQHGPFHSLEDLKKVRGIKDRIIEANKSRITFGDDMGHAHHGGKDAPQTATEAH
jgi:competence ComEA-like helix-hairpin-helix protein